MEMLWRITPDVASRIARATRCDIRNTPVKLVAMTESAVGPKLMEYLNGNFARVPMRRLVKPSEIAAGFAFLASDDASGITGINLTVDCGLTANWFILETIPDE